MTNTYSDPNPTTKDRITEIREVRLGDIAANENNPRVHPDKQRLAFRGVINEIGWAGVPLVYHSERQGKLVFLDGHMRMEELPDQIVKVAVTNLTDKEADIFLLSYDPISSMAEFNAELVAKLHSSVEIEDSDLMGLFNKLSVEHNTNEKVDIDYDEMWEGMPEFESKDKTSIQSVHIHFKTREDRNQFAILVKQKITEKTRSLWYPEAEIETYADKRYSSK